jgi:hypothetical protein
LSIKAHDQHGDGLVLEYREDVQSVLDANARERAESGRFDRKSEFRRTMRVPAIVLLKIREEYGWDYMNPEHWPMVSKLLKSPEYKNFRTVEGRI